MNKERRKEIAKAMALLSVAQESLEGANEIIESCMADEEEYFECMPENLQDSEKGQLAEAAVEALDRAKTAIEEFDFGEIEGDLDEASE